MANHSKEYSNNVIVGANAVVRTLFVRAFLALIYPKKCGNSVHLSVIFITFVILKDLIRHVREKNIKYR